VTPLEAVITNSQRLAATTRRGYRTAVRSFVGFAGADPLNWTPATVDAWMACLRVRPRCKNVYVAGLRYASRRWAALYDGRDFAGAAETVLVPADKHSRSPTPLDEDQLGAMLATCAREQDPTDLRDRAIIAIALHAGFRRAAIAGIEFDDLDHHERAIVVLTKRAKRLRVRVGEQCWGRVEAWLLWLRRRHVPTTGRVFRSLRRCLNAELGWCVGVALSPGAIYRIVRRRAKRAGIAMRVSPHSMRHSLVALLRDRGVPEEQIAKRLGHASTSTTSLYGGDIVRDVGDDGLPA
jgi:integrase